MINVMMTVLDLNILKSDFDGSIEIVYNSKDNGNDDSDYTSIANY